MANTTTETTTRWSWKQSPVLMERLRRAQNEPAHEGRDVLTFAGFLSSEAELARHVESIEGQVDAWYVGKRYCPMCDTWSRRRACKACGMPTETLKGGR
jgi:hypothetical protein